MRPVLRSIAVLTVAFWFNVALVGLVFWGVAASAKRLDGTTQDVLNESMLKRPGNLRFARVTAATTSVTLTSLTGASEIFIRNPTDATLCLEWALPGVTCTADCSGTDHVRLRQDETVSLPIPYGVNATTGISGFGSICADATAAAGNGEAIETMERDQ